MSMIVTLSALIPTLFLPLMYFFQPSSILGNSLLIHIRQNGTINKGSNFSIPKLGSNVGTNLDIKNKFVKATLAFKKLQNLCRFREQLRIRIYNAFIPTILRYNLHTKLQLNTIDTYHRK